MNYELPYPIRITGDKPDSDRQAVADIAARDLFVTELRAWNGMVVWVESDKSSYLLLDKTVPTWEKLNSPTRTPGTIAMMARVNFLGDENIFFQDDPSQLWEIENFQTGQYIVQLDSANVPDTYFGMVTPELGNNDFIGSYDGSPANAGIIVMYDTTTQEDVASAFSIIIFRSE